MGVGSSSCITVILWERQWRVVLPKVNEFCELMSAGKVTSCYTVGIIETGRGSMMAAVFAVSSFTVNLENLITGEQGIDLVAIWHAWDGQTTVVRGTPDTGSSCVQPENHTLSKTIYSHMLGENCLRSSTSEGSKLWFLEMKLSPLSFLIYIPCGASLNTCRTTDHIFLISTTHLGCIWNMTRKCDPQMAYYCQKEKQHVKSSSNDYPTIFITMQKWFPHSHFKSGYVVLKKKVINLDIDSVVEQISNFQTASSRCCYPVYSLITACIHTICTQLNHFRSASDIFRTDIIPKFNLFRRQYSKRNFSWTGKYTVIFTESDLLRNFTQTLISELNLYSSPTSYA